MNLLTKDILAELQPKVIGVFPKDFPIQVETDSRKSFFAPGSLFVALKGPNFDGNTYCQDAFEKGVSYFLVSDEKYVPAGANALIVSDTLRALQVIAKAYRNLFDIPVIGITGSNGKTVVKDWLADLCNGTFMVFKSPKSYNSQLGVALSLLRLKEYHSMAVIEAGISTREEMNHLVKMIQPTHGIFTHLGSAHDAGFDSKEEKLKEKWKLFEGCSSIVIQDHQVKTYWPSPPKTWHFVSESLLLNYTFNFQDETSKKNLATAIQMALILGVEEDELRDRVPQLVPPNMRLEQLQGINNCEIINDGYSLDMDSLQIALNFMKRQSNLRKKTIVVSDFDRLVHKASDYRAMLELLKQEGITKLIGIGPEISKLSQYCDDIESYFYSSTSEFLSVFNPEDYKSEEILIKGARKFKLEKIALRLQEKVHSTYVEINMNILSSNIDYFRSIIPQGVRLMAMVKAASYGSGTHQIANLLEYKKMDYLCVAYPDEGVELRKSGLSIPIMVLNTEKGSIRTCMDYQLEPVVYSLQFMQDIIAALQGEVMAVHLEVDTGMKRLGIDGNEISEALSLAKSHGIEIISVFSHFAGADDEMYDAFSLEQVATFDGLTKNLEGKSLRHLCNTAGILRFPQAHFDMVRLGIGMYGVNPTDRPAPLECALSLKTVISQIRHINKGESVGYSRNFVAEEDMKIAILPIGYADGIRRELSNKGCVYIHERACPIVGNVCMDMCMIDVSSVPCKEGDEAVFFENNEQLDRLAQDMQTIPYEVLTGISSRVNRVFVEE